MHEISWHAYKIALSVIPITLFVGLWISLFHIKEEPNNNADVKTVIEDAIKNTSKPKRLTTPEKEPYTLN